MKKMLSTALCLVVAQSISGAVGLRRPGYEAQVGHDGESFIVTESAVRHRVGRESLDETLKHIDHTNMARFLQKGRISAHKTSDGSYILRGHVNGLGGGPWGFWAGMWAGKIGTHFVAQAGISLVTAGVAIVCPPAAAPFYMAAQYAVVPTVEVASNVMAVGCGIAGGVITGPV